MLFYVILYYFILYSLILYYHIIHHIYIYNIVIWFVHVYRILHKEVSEINSELRIARIDFNIITPVHHLASTQLYSITTSRHHSALNSVVSCPVKLSAVHLLHPTAVGEVERR